jgi:hypothetical protein
VNANGGITMIRPREYIRMGFGHTFIAFLLGKVFFSSHPEFFTRTRKGERIHGPTSIRGQLCMSNLG